MRYRWQAKSGENVMTKLNNFELRVSNNLHVGRSRIRGSPSWLSPSIGGVAVAGSTGAQGFLLLGVPKWLPFMHPTQHGQALCSLSPGTAD